MMKKSILFICALILTGASFGQLTGTKNIPGSGGPSDYATVASAIADLNLQGTGPGGVTFNIAAGHIETFASPTTGLITATGSASNPILFQKSGTGANPVITAGIGISTSTDGIIVLAGGDYFTFDGINLSENSANITATTQMEWGFALVKARKTFPVDGCQYITIRNCSISLNASNANSAGIYSGNHLASSIAAINIVNIYQPVRAEDLSNNCRFYGNTISNVIRGFSLNGYNDNVNTPRTSYDMNNEIGIPGAGNTIIQNVSSTNICYAIWGHQQTNLKIAHNTISGFNAAGAMYGITPRTSNSADIHHNTITVSSASSSSSYAIDGNNGGAQGYTTEIHDNLIQNCTMTGTGGFTAIQVQTANPSVLNIYSNTITGNTAINGSIFLITFGGGGGEVNNIFNNLLYNNTKTGPGSFYCIANINWKSASIHDNQIYSNNINTTGVVTAASTLAGINIGQNGQTSEMIYNNLIYDLNISGTTTAQNNIIYGINTNLPSDADRFWNNNTVRNLSINTPAGSGTITGFNAANGRTGYIFKNQIYNLQANNTAGVVNGINIASGSQIYVYNNFISDLKTPESSGLTAINGILVAGGTNIGIYYNTIFINASSSASTFGTSGIYKTGASTAFDLRNNVIMNTSSPGSAGGFTVAHRWSGAYNPTYYSGLSNANNFYTGSPASNKLIFFDGTNTDQTLTDYQARVAPKDVLSFNENSPLVNSVTAPYDLHMSSTVPTLCENGGVAITTPPITDDIDGNVRTSTPDVGAHEFAGISIGVINPTGFNPTAMSSQQVSLPFILNPTGNNVVIVWNTTGYFTIPSGPPPAVNSSFAGGTILFNGTTSPVAHTGLMGGTAYYYKAFSYNGTSWSTGVPASAATNIESPMAFNSFAMAFDRIDLSWTKNNQNQDVIVAVNSSNSFSQPVNGTAYSPGMTLPMAGTVVYSGPLSGFSHTGLIGNTKYYYKIWSYDSYNWYSATGLTANATTLLCGPTSSIPFTEGFELNPLPPTGCGIVVDLNDDGITWAVGTKFPHGGTKSLACATSSASDGNDWYFAQGLNLTAGVTYQLSFWYRPESTYPQVKFEVKWGTAPNPGGMFATPLFNYITGTTTAYQQATVFVTPTESGAYYFGWHSISPLYFGFSGKNIILDDISVSTNPCPAPLTVTATGITTNSANIGWTGAVPNVQIDFGTPGHVAGTGTVINTSGNPYTLTGLSAFTSYDVYVRQDCGLASYSFWTGPVNFTTAYQAPVVTTGAATALSGPGATLNGTVVANGVSTQVYFEYGLTTGYGNSVTATPSPVTGTMTTTITANITGLIANGTVYHYRAVGYNNGMFTYGADQTFTTPLSAPTVATTAASLITSTGATLNGTINPNNTSASVVFEYGLTTAYGSTVTPTISTFSGNNLNNVSVSLAGLLPNTLYHYRIVGTNSAGTTNGADMTFTAVDLPTVTTTSATWGYSTPTAGILNLNGIVNANSSTATVSFQYGLTEDYGSVANGVPPTVTGNAPTNVTTANITLSGTNLNRVYHYRIVAVNSTGTSYGSDMTIATTKTPTVTTTAATFPATGITLNSTTGANNANTTLIYEYGLTSAFGSTIAYPSNPITGTYASGRATIVTGLLPGTLYYFRPVATNIAGTTTGATMTFTTPVLPTSATTLAATLITSTGAKLNGTVVTNTTPAVATNFRYEYGLTPATMILGSNPTPASSSANGTSSPALTLSGLLPNTTYYYRVYAVNAAGTVYGETMSFTTTAIVPTVSTLAAYGITPAGAILNGTVNANNNTATVTYEYGLTTTYGSTVTATQSPVTGNAATGVSVVLNGLQSNTLYNYRIVGVNAAGTSTGSNLTFTTLPILPEVASGAASSITSVGATLQGTVNANNASTIVFFEYGSTTAYGSILAAIPGTLSGTTTSFVSAGLTGLIPNRAYHFRCVGINNGGTSYGTDQEFTTPCLIPVIIITGRIFTCAGTQGNTYTTEAGNTNYTWTISPGGTITSGAGTNVITVTWNTTGYKTVSVNYSNIYGCWATVIPSFNVLVSPSFIPGTVAASQTINYNTAPAPLTGVSPTGGLTPYTYLWQSSEDGISFNDIPGATTLNYAPGALIVTTYYRLTQTSGGNCGTALTNVITITVNPNPVPPTTTVQGVIIGSGQTNCYNATQTIFVAGSGTIFFVQNGGSATMIAGQSIFFYPGTSVQEGGYLHGYIAPGGPWCSTPSIPVVNNPAMVGDVQTALPDIATTQNLKVYPNPTNGSFTIELNGTNDTGISKVEIVGMNGIKSQSVELNGESKSTIGTENLKPGIYFIQVTTGNGKETLKLIKM